MLILGEKDKLDFLDDKPGKKGKDKDKGKDGKKPFQWVLILSKLESLIKPVDSEVI